MSAHVVPDLFFVSSHSGKASIDDPHQVKPLGEFCIGEEDAENRITRTESVYKHQARIVRIAESVRVHLGAIEGCNVFSDHAL